ncbi:cysteine desulfurase [candidate division LCP-89 bacterium B3_LCP]|uniref:cysteine desulfurase n=1 Tax=candidate division LCP-89 bacterium B3_LCP TaxID=2012998 RepID=A0A532UW38_UNCL8|nr:MAG: cysteine desulfurase [candidate division LCP-89 bacterium B3_LCP]
MEDLIYLDNAATAWPKPPNVYEFAIDFYRKTGVNPGRSGFDMAIEAGNIIEDLRVRLTKFFGGDENVPERLCFSYNATDALNLIIPGLLVSGDHVISTNVEHNSVIRPINCMVRDQGVEATYVPFNKQGYVDPDDIKYALKPNTKLVIVNHGSNVLGTVQPLKEIGQICRDKGVLFAIDSSQTAGVVPIDMKDMNIDVLAFTGHKSLMGFTGIGGLCVREHLEIKQIRAGGTGVRSAYPYHLAEYPFRMEYGTPNMIGVASLLAGQDFIEEEGMANIHAREMKLARKLVEGFRQIDGVIIYCWENFDNRLSTVTINIEGMEAGDVGIMLDVDFDVATRTGLHCAPLVHEQLGLIPVHGGVRFSVGAFNVESDIDTAIEAVKEIAGRVKR